jgi:hypothetical protein
MADLDCYLVRSLQIYVGRAIGYRASIHSISAFPSLTLAAIESHGINNQGRRRDDKSKSADTGRRALALPGLWANFASGLPPDRMVPQYPWMIRAGKRLSVRHVSASCVRKNVWAVNVLTWGFELKEAASARGLRASCDRHRQQDQVTDHRKAGSSSLSMVDLVGGLCCVGGVRSAPGD